MDIDAKVRDHLQKLNLFDTYRVKKYISYRRREGGDDQEVDITIRDAGPEGESPDIRFLITAENLGNGKKVGGNAASTRIDARSLRNRL